MYAVKQAIDYSGFWQNVVGAERPKGVAGHAGVSGEVVYGAFLAPSADATMPTICGPCSPAEIVAGAAFAGRSVPPWFSRGAGRALATRVAPKAVPSSGGGARRPPRCRGWVQSADFFDGHAEPGAATAAAGGFVTAIAPGGKLHAGDRPARRWRDLRRGVFEGVQGRAGPGLREVGCPGRPVNPGPTGGSAGRGAERKAIRFPPQCRGAV